MLGGKRIIVDCPVKPSSRHLAFLLVAERGVVIKFSRHFVGQLNKVRNMPFAVQVLLTLFVGIRVDHVVIQVNRENGRNDLHLLWGVL